MKRLKKEGLLVCVGDITPDIMIPYGETLGALSNLCAGKVETCTPVLRPGGAVANTVATLGRLGMRPYMVSGVGNDEYGDFLVDHLKACGVHTEYIFRQKERMSLILAVLDSAGERVLYLYNGPGAKLPELEERHMPSDIVPRIGWVHANGFANDVIVDFMEQCANAGAVISFDLNLRCETFGLDARRKSRIKRAIKTSTVLIGSGTEEFTPLTGITDLCGAARSLESPERVVVARDGPNSVHLFAQGEYTRIPVLPTRVVNKVGGGDAFNGGFIAAYSMGLSACEAVKWGNCCAASAIGSHEPHCIPSREVIAEIVRNYPVT